nr:hypothetical protein [Buchnera aphidicola]
MYPIKLRAIQNFWRNNIYYFSQDVAAIFIKKWSDPQKLLEYLYKWLDNSHLQIYQKKIEIKTIEQKHIKLINQIKNLKNIWNQEKNNIFLLFSQLKINKKIYNQKNLKIWYERIQSWTTKKTYNYKFPNILKYFSLKKIKNHVKNHTKLRYHFFIK